jgi:hypothetical protein
MDADRKNRERRRAAYEHASKVHERAAKTESDAADLFDSIGETEKAARHRALSEQQMKSAEEDAGRAAEHAEDSDATESQRKKWRAG